MKKRTGSGEEDNGSKSKFMQRKNKNLKRLGGSGLSLEAFANAKSTSNHYNPALIKKQREFYKNAKHVSKYKKSVKQQNRLNDKPSSSTIGYVEGENETQSESQMKRCWKGRNKGLPSLQEVYEKKRQEEEKARMEKEASIAAKKKEKERAKARRNSMREKMFKRTQKGQPVMKFRIEHLLETIGASLKS